MSLTYTRVAERDVWRTRTHARRLREGHLLLASTSLLAVLAIGLAYGGKLRSGTSSPHGGTPINLATVTDWKALEPAFQPVFTNAADRRFAAQHLFQYIAATRSSDRPMSNVGAISAATVPADAVRGESMLLVYPERLRRAIEHAASVNAAAPTSLPLLEPGDLALVKPSFSIRTPDEFAAIVWRWGLGYVASFWAVALFWWARGSKGDLVLLASAHMLTAIGFATLLGRPDPFRDTLLIVRYTQGIMLGLGLAAAISTIDLRKARTTAFSYLPLIGALCLCLLLIAFGTGPGRSSAKVNLGPVQPIEAIRLLLALFLAGYFARRWEVLREVTARTVRDRPVPAWLKLPQLHYVLPVLVGVGAALLLFFVQKDLGPALFLCCVFLATYAVARRRIGMPLLGLAVLVGGFYVGYTLNISSTLTSRVQMWASPWDNGVAGGDHVAQAMWAMSTGGVFGTGLGIGSTRYLSAGHTDLILAAIGEELGFVGLLMVGVLYGVIAIRGFRAARNAATDYGFFLAITLTLCLVLPVLIMAAGMLGLIPLTGVVTPFLSYGGSAMAANFAALGALAAIRSSASHGEREAFRIPTRAVAVTLGSVAVVLVTVLLNVQVVHADAFVVRPHLGIQADGVRRYHYNQRVLDVAALVPRGTVFDRKHLALATGDPETTRRARTDYAKLGIDLDASCGTPLERCYPLGSAAFHLLGDARTHLNWSASNTSYVERDFEDRLRGFDDRAVVVQTRDAAGRPTSTIRRDYAQLVPLLRHRHDLDDHDAKAILAQRRDITLTIDARFQARLAGILGKYANKSSTGRAAAVVLDPDTGDLLASANYPTPTFDTDVDDEGDTTALLDRARFGLYPPGSTFKLVTAAAALRKDLGSTGTTFMCRTLPGGRVGTAIPGWSRPVRDDVLDTHPHGVINMHEGLVASCNAYFAQLAVRLGPQPLLDTAMRVGISVAPDNSIARLRDTLPQAGYGQGDVVATPLRMARLAAAIADDGVLRDVRVTTSSHPSHEDAFLKPAAADTLARYLRDAVLTGTGKSLRNHPGRIAGKTGTAEVADAPSHSWFVGFAPYGRAEKRVAFAIVIENAGYGGLAAAPVAGELVSAAMDAGLAR